VSDPSLLLQVQTTSSSVLQDFSPSTAGVLLNLVSVPSQHWRCQQRELRYRAKSTAGAVQWRSGGG
jgi:hypothetical protein